MFPNFHLSESLELPFEKKINSKEIDGWPRLSFTTTDCLNNVYLFYQDQISDKGPSYSLYKVSMPRGVEWEISLANLKQYEDVTRITSHQTMGELPRTCTFNLRGINGITVDGNENVYIRASYALIFKETDTLAFMESLYVYYRVNREGQLYEVARYDSGWSHLREPLQMLCDSHNYLCLFYLIRTKYPDKRLLIFFRYTPDGKLVYQSRGFELERRGADSIVFDPEDNIYYGFHTYPYRVYKFDKNMNFLVSFAREVQANVPTWEDRVITVKRKDHSDPVLKGVQHAVTRAPDVIRELLYSKHHHRLFVFLGVEAEGEEEYKIDILHPDFMGGHQRAGFEETKYFDLRHRVKYWFDNEGYLCVLRAHRKVNKVGIFREDLYEYFVLEKYELKG